MFSLKKHSRNRVSFALRAFYYTSHGTRAESTFFRSLVTVCLPILVAEAHEAVEAIIISGALTSVFCFDLFQKF